VNECEVMLWRERRAIFLPNNTLTRVVVIC
jgi:hypothetical protein